jgi:hypothetical protein
MEGWYRKQGCKKPKHSTVEAEKLGDEEPETESRDEVYKTQIGKDRQKERGC